VTLCNEQCMESFHRENAVRVLTNRISFTVGVGRAWTHAAVLPNEFFFVVVKL